MKRSFIHLIIFAAFITSCSTYKAAQTPDDVYYSPAKEVAYKEEVTTRRDRYQENLTSTDDRFLRMKVQNNNRWNAIDDYGYWYDSRYDYNVYNNNYYNNNPYAFNNWNRSMVYGSCFAPNYYGYGRSYYGNSGYYSPAYPVVYYKSPKVYSGATGKSNLGTYTNTRYNNQNTNFRKGAPQNNGFGNLVKKVFTNTNNGNNNSTYDRPARTFEPSTTTPGNSAGGRSGGYSSTGSSSSTPRAPRN